MAAVWNAIRYLLVKLTASGLAWLLFYSLVLLANGGRVGAVYGMMRNSLLLFVFFVYGTACSVCIDGILLLVRSEEKKRAGKWLLFTLSGFLFFICALGLNPGTVLLGLIGAFFALMQAAASFWLARSRFALYPAAAVIVLLLASGLSGSALFFSP